MNSASDSDDWDLPRKSENDAGLNSDDVQFADSDGENLLGRGKSVLRYGPGRSKRKAANKPKAKGFTVGLSHLATASETCDNDSPCGPNPAPTTLNDTEPPQNRNDSTGLFVSETEEDLLAIDTPFMVEDFTEINHRDNVLAKLPINTMDGLKRARTIKENINKDISAFQPPGAMINVRPHSKDGPENKIILDLRNEQDMSWGDIANFLNQERRNIGEAADLTASAIYCRYVRSTPKVAVPTNELGFDAKDYMHLHHPNQYNSGEGTNMISKAGKKRVKNYDNAKELESNMRKLVAEDEYGDLETVEKTEQLMEAVAKVERNFWALVADEMERATTKLYPAARLASRYNVV